MCEQLLFVNLNSQKVSQNKLEKSRNNWYTLPKLDKASDKFNSKGVGHHENYNHRKKYRTNSGN